MSIRGSYTDSFHSTPLYSNDAFAVVFLRDTSYGGLKNILVNNKPVDGGQINGLFAEYFSASNYISDTLNFSTGANWAIAGNGYIPDFSYSFPGDQPAFTDSLPSVISLNNDFTMSFSASNTVNADSAYVFLEFTQQYNSAISFTSVVSAKNGTVSIPKMYFSQSSTGGARLHVLLFSYKYDVFGNKQFAFLKLNENIRSVIFQ